MHIAKKMTALLLSTLFFVSALTGCGDKGELTSGANEKDYPVTINEVTIKSEPMGVVVLSPNLADVILAMSFEILLKGKSENCTQSDLSVLPNMTVNDVDAIKKAGADLVLLDTEPTEEAKQALTKEGINVLVFPSAVNRKGIEELYSEIGAVLKGGQTGYNLGLSAAQDIFYTIDDVERVIPVTNTPVSACYLYDTEGGAATGDQLAGKLIESSGLLNAFAGNTNGKVDFETMKIVNPQYIFCATGLKEEMATKSGYKDLNAVKNGLVFEMDPTYMTLQGRGMIQAVILMAGTVYPELTEGDDPVSSMEPPEGTTSSVESKNPASGSVATGKTLKKGDKGDDVKALQQKLDKLGYMFLPCTGEYGDGTEQAVKDFQLLNKLDATGTADPQTQAKLDSPNAVARGNN